MIWRRRGMRAFGGAGIVRHGGPNSIRPICRGLASALLAALLGSSALAGSFDVLVTSGDVSPDGNGELVTFTPPALNDAGQVAFLSQLANTNNSTLDDVALLRGTDLNLTIIARKGETNLDGQTISNFVNNSPSISGAGTVSHSADRATAPDKFVAFLGTGGSLDSYLGVDSASPSGMNTLFGHSIPVINGTGVATYRASYSGANPETGIYSRTPAGTATLRLAEGNYGLTEYITLNFSLPTINETSQIGLAASVDDGFSTRKAVIRLDGTTIVELARDGALTTDGVTTIGNIFSNAVPINAAGQLAFASSYTQPAVASQQGVFLANNGSLSLLTPNLLPGATTATTNLLVTELNDAGNVAFTTEFIGSGDLKSGVYLANTAGTTLVAFEDTATPDAAKFYRRFLPETVTLNQNGQLAFLAELSDTVDGVAAGRGLYRFDPVNGLEQIVRTGDTFAGSTIASLNFVGDFYSAASPVNSRQAPDADFSGLNDSGEMAFVFALANGDSGIAIWSEAAASLFGDFNDDGYVDAADYTVWRNNVGDLTDDDIHNLGDGVAGINEADYDVWRSHYGDVYSPGAGGLAGRLEHGAVPEPSTFMLFGVALACLAVRRTL